MILRLFELMLILITGFTVSIVLPLCLFRLLGLLLGAA